MRNSRFDKILETERRINRFQSVFWCVFCLAGLLILAYWGFLAYAAVNTIKCAGDAQCVEQTGRVVGSFIKGVKETAQ
jgi:hypothetical protein